MSQKAIRGGMVDMTTGSPIGHIVRFAIPLLIGNVFQQLYNTVDTLVVGHFTETPKLAQAAVNTASPLVFLMVAMFAGLGMGATVILSQNYGAGEMDAVRRTVRTIHSSAVIVSIPLSLTGILLAPLLMKLLGVPDNIRGDAYAYVVILFVGLIGTMGYNINAGILQGLGDSKTPLRFLTIACLLNIVLDLLFVAVFHWGVAGVAAATVIAQIFSWIYGLVYIRKHFPELELRPLRIKADGVILRKCVRIGLPVGIQQSLFSVGLLFMQRLVNSGGDAFIAGFGNANRIDTFVFMPIMSFGAALTTFTAQNMGVSNIARVRQGLRRTVLLSLAVYLLTAAPVLLFAKHLLWLFNNDSEVIQSGLYYLNAILPFTFLITIQFMFSSVLRGAGDAMIPLITTLIAFLLVRIPAAYVIAHVFQLKYIYFSFGIGWVVGLSIAAGAYAAGRWKRKSLVIRSKQEDEHTEDAAVPDPAANEG